MKLARPLLTLSGFALLGLSAQAANTWYVDVHATAPGDGSQASPYTSIQYALTQPTTHSGDTVLVAPGEYTENVVMNLPSLSLRSIAGPLVTTIRPAHSGDVVTMSGSDTSELVGFTVTGLIPNGDSAGIFVTTGEEYIRNCIVRGNIGGAGIASLWDAFAENCTVTGNTFGVHAVAFGGIVFVDSSIVSHNVMNEFDDKGSGATTVTYSFISDSDPGFWDYEHGDLHLRPGSVCIDTGNPAQHDPDGSVIDRGALAFDPTYAPANMEYCTGKITSQGCVPAISGQGQASATSANAFWINGDQAVDHKSGLLVYGVGVQSLPFQGGTLCVSGYHRTPPQSSGGSGACTGHWQYDMNARIQSGIDPNLVPGKFIYAQWWGRDPLDPAGFGSQLSDALRFGIAP